MGDFYIGGNGIFFVSLMIQQGCFSAAFYLLNLTDIMNSFFSPWLAYHKRKVFQDMEPWLRKEENTFQFGYFYAQLLTVFGICIFFSSQVPLITVASAFFVIIRHAVDCVNLITVYRKEIDSQGRLIETATNTALIYVIGY